MANKRKLIFGKYNGHCAYCGCDLPKNWHIDHIEPLVRNPLTGEQKYPERDNILNLNPSCASCNNYKHSMSLEEFREQIGQFTKRLSNDSKYKIAKRFGLVIEAEFDVKFYFEKFIEAKQYFLNL
jgi:5-methylcytosine-specific restriction endonuclease McrA